MIRIATLVACLAIIGHMQGQGTEIVRGEYWIDQDLGIGANVSFEIPDDQNVLGLELQIPLIGYGPGIHTIGIRTVDETGLWSLTNFSTAVVVDEPATPPINLARLEYFLNTDPGFGNAFSVPTGSADEVDLLVFDPDITEAVAGGNTLFIRSQTSDGHWGLTNHSTMVVIEPEPIADIVRVETFPIPGADPGFGLADQHSVDEPAQNLVDHQFTAPAPGYLLGDTLMIRAQDSNERWSLTNHVVVSGHTSVDALATGTSISVYPNPFTEGITVKTEDGLPVRVVLYDPQGKLVHDKVLTGETRIDLQGLATGAYTAFFWKELERIHRVTLIKQ